MSIAMRTEAMERRRFNQQSPNEGRASLDLQRKPIGTRRFNRKNDQPQDLTDFMNDMFFGTINVPEKKKAYNLTGGEGRAQQVGRDEDDFDSSTRSVSSRQTQDWLEEAKRIVASSPTRGNDSPSKLVASPRFAISQGRSSTSSLDRRDPFSRSARRQRALEGFSGEILARTTKHIRNRSDTNLDPPSPSSDSQKLSSILKVPNSPDPTTSPDHHAPPSPTSHHGAPPLPPRQSMHRRSRFQNDPNAPLSHPIQTPSSPPIISLSKRNFKYSNPTSNANAPTTILENELLSPPKHLIESAHRRSISSSTCTVPEAAAVLSPPRNLVESAHRRSVSSSTCRSDRVSEKDVSDDGQMKDASFNGQDLNGFLKEQRIKIEKLLSGEINGKAKIVLSGPSNSTSSMVAATCYAWLLENRMRANKKEGSRNDSNLEFVVPVMNPRRGKMWTQRQAAWLFHHVSLDASSLIFSNEVDLETLMMAKQLSMLVVGEDILKTNGEVGSACTVLTDNYCEDAYDLLQTPMLKKLLLAGIILDTQNLSTSPKLSMTRDAEAVQLLSVTSAPNYRNTLFDQLIQDQRDNDFFEVLRSTYGTPPREIKWDGKLSEKSPPAEVISQDDDKKGNDANDARTRKVSPIAGKPTTPPVPPPPKANDTPRKKNNNFFARLFGFGSK